MMEVAHSIDLNLAEKLQDREYRHRFFWAEASSKIAAQLIALRKRRELSQKQVAEITRTKQPAISRAEQADYQNWNLNTLRSIAEALDARVRVLIEPWEDIVSEYQEHEDYHDAGIGASRPDVFQNETPPYLHVFAGGLPVSNTSDFWTRGVWQAIGTSANFGDSSGGIEYTRGPSNIPLGAGYTAALAELASAGSITLNVSGTASSFHPQFSTGGGAAQIVVPMNPLSAGTLTLGGSNVR